MQRKNIVATAICIALSTVGIQSAFSQAQQPPADKYASDEIKAAPPVIPDKTFNLKDFGAVGDYKAFDTDAIKKAIAAVEAAGGGHLIVPAGTYKTLPFTLTSHMDLHLDAGATIKAPDTFADYGLPDPSDSMQPAGAGGPGGRGGRGGRGGGRGGPAPASGAAPAPGAAPGPGAGFAFPDLNNTYPVAAPAAPAQPDAAPASPAPGRGRGGAGGGRGGAGRGPGGGGIGSLISCPANTTDLAITGNGTVDGSGAMFWIFTSKAAQKYEPFRVNVPRPRLVALSGVQRLHIDGVSFINSPNFNLALHGDDLLIENVHIFEPSDSPNTDGIDPGGNRIVIRNCNIDNGDDDIAVQSGSKDILIEDITSLHGHGISIGSGTRAGLSHMIVRRCSFNGTDNGLRIKSYRGNGGEVHDITYSDITMDYVRHPFDINMLYNGNTPTMMSNGLMTDVGPRDPAGQATNGLPNFYDIHVTNLTIRHSPIAGRFIGLPELMPHDITFTNVHVQSNRGFLVQDTNGVKFVDVHIDAAIGDPIVTDNATGELNGKPFSGTSGGSTMPWY